MKTKNLYGVKSFPMICKLCEKINDFLYETDIIFKNGPSKICR